MSVSIRRSADRGHFDHGWLDTHHTFSFGGYYDAQHMGYHGLRVLNEDRVQPGKGFGRHGHANMEILTYVIDGALQHRDSLGHGSVLKPGFWQHMSAGAGIEHSEFNPLDDQVSHFLQIWIEPAHRSTTPRWQEKPLAVNLPDQTWQKIASPLSASDSSDDSLGIDQDVTLWQAKLRPGQSLPRPLTTHPFGWVQVISGTPRLTLGTDEPLELHPGDGVALAHHPEMLFWTSEHDAEPAEFLLFDLPG